MAAAGKISGLVITALLGLALGIAGLFLPMYTMHYSQASASLSIKAYFWKACLEVASTVSVGACKSGIDNSAMCEDQKPILAIGILLVAISSIFSFVVLLLGLTRCCTTGCCTEGCCFKCVLSGFSSFAAMASGGAAVIAFTASQGKPCDDSVQMAMSMLGGTTLGAGFYLFIASAVLNFVACFIGACTADDIQKGSGSDDASGRHTVQMQYAPMGSPMNGPVNGDYQQQEYRH